MAEQGVSEVETVESNNFGGSSPAKESVDTSPAVGGEVAKRVSQMSDSPKIRRSERKKSLHPSSSRGRFIKSGPKSPLMRMAEMRKGGLRGCDLRPSGRKGLEGDGLRGKKGLLGRGSQVLKSIPECYEISDDGVWPDRAGEESAGGVDESSAAMVTEVSGVGASEQLAGRGSPISGVEVGGSSLMGQPEAIPPGLQSDLVLDLIAAQPLQVMDFVGVHVPPVRESNVEKVWQSLEMNPEEISGGKATEDFPPLSRDSLKAAKEKERGKGVEGKEAPRGMENLTMENPRKNKEGLNPKASGSGWAGTRNYKASLEGGIHTGGKLLESFEPEKIRKMGCRGKLVGFLQSNSRVQRLRFWLRSWALRLWVNSLILFPPLCISRRLS